MKDSIQFKGNAANEAFKILARTPKPHTPIESALSEALLLVLDNVDYVRGNCGVTEMVGAVLPKEIIAEAREALAKAGIKSAL